MKIAVSSNDDRGLESTVCEHFGRCPFFTFITVNEKVVEKIEVVENPFSLGHQPFEIPTFLQSKGIQVMITQGMGARAINFFINNHIIPITGCTSTVQEAVDAYLAGKLNQAAPCVESMEHQHLLH